MNAAPESAVTCDVLVIGSGAGGLATAITARKLGLDVLVVEKEAVVGGTTALSGGWLWVPCSPHAIAAGVVDDVAEARHYISVETGDRFDAARVDAYLDAAPRMVAFFERETALRFFLGASYPDYHPQKPGGRPGGRAICAEPYDGRGLGEHLAWLRTPLKELTLFGLKVGSGPDFNHFFNARRSWRSARYVAARVLRHLSDQSRHGRDVMLMSGNALAGRLLRTALDLRIPIWRNAPAIELTRDRRRVTGAIVERNGVVVEVSARRGVVCAAGGFPRDARRRSALSRYAIGAGDESLAAPGNTGDGLRLAEAAGGSVDDACESFAAWMPVSRVTYRDGSTGLYPHSFERGKPGVIAVTPAGVRFANESDSYHDFVVALLNALPGERSPHAYFVCDQRFVRRYGLGMAKPFPLPMRPYLRSGYLVRAASLQALAVAIGIDAARLAETVTTFNRHARQGEDPMFGRGGNAYNHYQGDPLHEPNPCLAPIEQPPFYAVKVLPGDLGTFMGIRTDARARVLGPGGEPVPGLYAAGTDMASVFAGSYPGPGANLGPAMTFGYLCAHDLAERAPGSSVDERDPARSVGLA